MPKRTILFEVLFLVISAPICISTDYLSYDTLPFMREATSPILCFCWQNAAAARYDLTDKKRAKFQRVIHYTH